MKVKVIMIPSNKRREVEIRKGSTIFHLLQSLELKPDTVIVTRENIPVPVDDIISVDTELKIIQVASGG